MLRKRLCSALLLVLPVAHATGLSGPEDVVSDSDYTLVQYISTAHCTGDRYVCQTLTKDSFAMHVDRNSNKVCAKLEMNSTDSTWAVDSCFATKGSCPKEDCHCYEAYPKLVLDECHGQSGPGWSSSIKLVKGIMEGCTMSGTRHVADIDGARWCLKYPSSVSSFSKKAAAEGVAADPALLARRARRTIRRARRTTPGGAARLNVDDSRSEEDLPEQGFSGKDVDHVNGETHTEDWRTEYGPNASPQKASEKPHKSDASRQAGTLAVVSFVLLGLHL